MRVRLDLSYDGTDFSGWAVQPDRRTVQAELESALATVLQFPTISLIVAGRTDAGVHAIGQVVHLDLPATVWAGADPRLLRRLNRVLPDDVSVRAMQVVPDAFDARFSALWRRYEYLICDGPSGVDPLRRRQVLAWPRRLDDALMAKAAVQLLGLHDFGAFCRRRAGATTVRTLLRLDVVRTDAEIRCTVVADAFCHSMVRSLVGGLLAVGEGRRDVSWPAGLLDRDRRADEIGVAAAHGLTLVEVGYPAATQFAARAEQSRARRD